MASSMATRSLTILVVGASTNAWFVRANRQRSKALSYFLVDFADRPHTRQNFKISTPETPEFTNRSRWDCSVTGPPIESVGRDF